MIDHNTFIERMGLAAENDGLSRIAGRLFGAPRVRRREWRWRCSGSV
jgi:hypothetical protein